MPDEEVPWDAQTDSFVNDLDSTIDPKYGISLRKLMLTPQKYFSEEGIADKLENIRKDVKDYFAGLEEIFADEEQDVTKQLENIDSIFNQVNQAITSRASIARVPFIKPLDLSFGDSNPETVFINQYNSQVDALITKLINISNYICDLSTTYKKYMIGSWLFSGSRSYMLALRLPESPLVFMENSKDIINASLAAFEDALPESASKK